MRWRSVISAASIATPSHVLYIDAADGDDRAEQQRHSSEVSGEEHGPNRHAAHAHECRDGVVVEHESILRVQDRSIAREQFRIEVLRDSRDVERLIAHAVAVAAAVENGDEAKRKRACGERGTSIDAQRARILLDQMAVITTDRGARAVVSIGFCKVVGGAVHQLRHAGHDDLAHVGSDRLLVFVVRDIRRPRFASADRARTVRARDRRDATRARAARARRACATCAVSASLPWHVSHVTFSAPPTSGPRA